MNSKTINLTHDDGLYYEDHTTSAATNFYGNSHHLDDDIYDFSNVKPSLHLDTSSNNPTDDEDEGKLLTKYNVSNFRNINN
jgi:hypothetical protein